MKLRFFTPAENRAGRNRARVYSLAEYRVIRAMIRCHLCGCSETSACWHDNYGACWWADTDEPTCSH